MWLVSSRFTWLPLPRPLSPDQLEPAALCCAPAAFPPPLPGPARRQQQQHGETLDTASELVTLPSATGRARTGTRPLAPRLHAGPESKALPLPALAPTRSPASPWSRAMRRCDAACKRHQSALPSPLDLPD